MSVSSMGGIVDVRAALKFLQPGLIDIAALPYGIGAYLAIADYLGVTAAAAIAKRFQDQAFIGPLPAFLKGNPL